jgi:hypothetical protein
MIKIIAGAVGSGKSKEVFKEVRDVLDNTEDRVLLIACEYTSSYAMDKVGYARNPQFFITDSVSGQDVKSLAQWILRKAGGISIFHRVYIDGFMPNMDDLELIDAMAKHSDIEHVVVTMQTNRSSKIKDVTIMTYENGMLSYNGESVTNE